MAKSTTVIGLLGTTLDNRGVSSKRWEKWRPTVSLCQQEDFIVNRLVLLRGSKFASLSGSIEQDVAAISPETRFEEHVVDFGDPWDFEEVYGRLLDFCREFEFDTDKEDYLVHVTTGTHVAQICLFLLTESRFFPAKLVQTAPPKGRDSGPGSLSIVDLDLSQYDSIAMRYEAQADEERSYLKSGIHTRNPNFNRLIERIEQVALASRSPILLSGPTGAGKSQLAKRIYELKRTRHQLGGQLVEVNCATLRGDAAMSALFGHTKGAFTGAERAREGLLRKADGGMLFLDEIGELGLDEQAMLLRAIEDRSFLPVGADTEAGSDFQLIAGTNRDLRSAVIDGSFREDLLARIDLWDFQLPGICERPEDIEPNLDYELERFSQKTGERLGFNKEARNMFLEFAASPTALWRANFRDFNAAVTRMGTLSRGGRITEVDVEEEIERLRHSWRGTDVDSDDTLLLSVLGNKRMGELDLFDRVQLAEVLRVCRTRATLSEAGRELFARSRLKKKNANDADRLRKYLAKFDLAFEDLV
ncbi:MAG: RNA repair transcriptional activator RtcR [Bdellovibrionales bacterium]|nr:RNA repair transcriptional activator RtcR [Bdellovibrionales bacterium]